MPTRNIFKVQEALDSLTNVEKYINNLIYKKDTLDAEGKLGASAKKYISNIASGHKTLVEALLYYGNSYSSVDSQLSSANKGENTNYCPVNWVEYSAAPMPERNFWEKTLNQVIEGDFSDDVTWLGSLISIAAAVVGIDAPMDARDMVANIQKKDWFWAGVSLVSLLPVIGAFAKGLDVAADTAKAVDNLSDTAKAIENASDVSKTGNKIADVAKVSEDSFEGIRIINKDYAGEVFRFDSEFVLRSPNLSMKYPDLAIKYPDGVKFSTEGFPDFSPYRVAEVKVEGLKGNYTSDFTAANKAAGFDITPTGYTWHHVEDGITMQLIPSDLHDAVRHTGGAFMLKNGLLP